MLVESARKVNGAGVFEQGAGALDVVAAFDLLSRYTPSASLLPSTLDLTDPYMWPYNRQASGNREQNKKAFFTKKKKAQQKHYKIQQ